MLMSGYCSYLQDRVPYSWASYSCKCWVSSVVWPYD